MQEVGDKSDEELRQARRQLVDEVRQLNDQVAYAKLSPHKAERRQLVLEREIVYEALRSIDAELKRRGIDLRNV